MEKVLADRIGRDRFVLKPERAGWKKIWEGIQQSREQKHRRMLENFKMVELKEYKEEIQEQCQIRFE